MLKRRVRIRLAVWALLMGNLVACSPLEREGVPVSFSLRLDGRIEPSVIRNDFAAVRSIGATAIYFGLVLEQNPETRLPKFNRTALAQLAQAIGLAREKGLAVGLIVSHTEAFPLFPGDSLGCPPQAWFAKLRSEWADVLDRCKETPLQRIVIGTELGPAEDYPQLWDSLLVWLRTQTAAPLAYTRFVGGLAQPPAALWSRVDEIGLAYELPPIGSIKAACRQWNAQASQLAQQYGKPVFISGANLLLHDKDTQFLNRLRFWEEGVSLAGININCIYSVTALSDTSDYFGLPQGSPGRTQIESYIQ